MAANSYTAKDLANDIDEKGIYTALFFNGRDTLKLRNMVVEALLQQCGPNTLLDFAKRIQADTVLDGQSHTYYKRLINVYKLWADDAINGTHATSHPTSKEKA